MRYMDLHKSDYSEKTVNPEVTPERGDEFFQSLAPAGYAPSRTMSLPGLEGLFFVVLTTAALVGGMLLISLVTSRDLSIGGAGAGSLQMQEAASTPLEVQVPATAEFIQPTDQGESLQNTGGVQGTAVGAQVLQAGMPIGEIRY